MEKLTNKILVMLMLLVFCQLSFGQKIGKNKAFEIAQENGLVEGIEEPVIELNNNVWTIKCLLCDESSEIYQVIEIDATTGEVKMVGGSVEMSIAFGETAIKTEIQNFSNWDSIPQKKLNSKPTQLITPTIERECNTAISPNNQLIAFQYGRKEIGIVNVNSQVFEGICTDCMYPQWIDNDWLAYLKDNNQIFKKNIKTHQEQAITEPGTFHHFQISPNNKWIAYTSSEVWNIQKKDSLRLPIFHLFNYGQGQDLCLQSMDGRVKKYITKIEKYVYSPCWSENGDTLFFNIENSICFATQLEDDKINYQPVAKLNLISITDYQQIEKGLLPLKYNCKIYAIDINTGTPKYVLSEKPGRYADLLFSHDLKYLIYTKQDFKNSDKKLWIQKLD